MTLSRAGRSTRRQSVNRCTRLVTSRPFACGCWGHSWMHRWIGESERMERAEEPASPPDRDVMAARMASMEAKIARRDKLVWIKDLFVPVVTLMLMYLGYRNQK